MRTYEIDDGMPQTTRWYTRAPTRRIALQLNIPDGCHPEPDDVIDDRLPGFHFYFIVNNATGEVINYLGIRETRP